MISDTQPNNRLESLTFRAGALVFLAWFIWSSWTHGGYEIEEWLLFYSIAVVCWQPMAHWLFAGASWVPAAELFFLLHFPYYVTPFVLRNEAFAELESSVRIKVGLSVILFLVVCRVFYRVPTNARSAFGRHGLILDRQINQRWRNEIAWGGIILWCLFTLCLLSDWLPDLGSYFNTVRSFVWTIGTLGIFVLWYENGCGRLVQFSKNCLIIVTALTLIFQVASGFLIGGAIQVSTIFLSIFYGSKKLPLKTMLATFAIFAFLHLGKADMRAQFWDPGANYSSELHTPLEITKFWVAASWKRLTTDQANDDQSASLIERGNLLNYVGRAVSTTPEFLPYMDGVTYGQTPMIFIPRFFWPEKPRASTPNETLAIYYGVQTPESVNVTAIGMGRISEAWANFGWVGVCIAGAVMGLILQIPTRLSAGYSPLHVRFLLSIPFIAFALALEECLGPALHVLSISLLWNGVVLWLASIPTAQDYNQQKSYRAARETKQNATLIES